MHKPRLQLLSKHQAAARLGVSERTVRRLIDSGTLTACRVRGCVRIPLAALESYIVEAIEKFQRENGEPEF